MLKELHWDGMEILMLKELPMGWHGISHALRRCQWDGIGSLMLKELQLDGMGSLMLKELPMGLHIISHA